MKKILPSLSSPPGERPGFALLILQGWTSTPDVAQGQLCEISIQRNQDSRYLGSDGQWAANQIWLQIECAAPIGESPVLAAGPDIVDALMQNHQMVYMLQVRVGLEVASGVIRIRENVLSSLATGESPTLQGAIPISAGNATHQGLLPKVPDAVPERGISANSIPQSAPANPGRGRLAVVTGVALMTVLVMGIGGYFGWKALDSSAKNSAVVSDDKPAPVEAPAPCSVDVMRNTKDDLDFIQLCLKINPNTQAVLAAIAAAKKINRCDLVQRLYAYKAQSGDTEIAMSYAFEFDPDTFVAGGCIERADKDTALYWYELVVAKDPDNAKAKDRIYALRK